jgi:O-acetylhomoserine/O-acetylserine sulfhydrylase-like pyridoxal-dependent enzyme
MLAKCINTQILARFLAGHPAINVHCSALAGNDNAALTRELVFLGLSPPLFTIDMPGIPREAFQRFFDCLAPTFDHMISLGQTNTIVSCPALTTHSELQVEQLREAGISPTTIRFAVGLEDPRTLVAHFIDASRLAIDPAAPGFSEQFMPPDEIEALVRDCYLDVHRRYIESQTQQ